MKFLNILILEKTKNKDGFIIMISLWILVLISLLSLGLAHRVTVNLKLARFQKDKLKCLYIAKAAVQKTLSVAESALVDSQIPDTLNQLWSTGYDVQKESYILKDVKLGDGVFTVSYIFDDTDQEFPIYFYGASDEDRKININTASRELLISLFTLLIVDEPEYLAEAIIYWRGDDPEVNDPYYGSSEVPYLAPQAPFQTIDEISLVKGFRGNWDLINNCEKLLSVYPEETNINTASSTVLEAIFMGLGAEGFSDVLSEIVIDYRDGIDNIEGTEDDVGILFDEIKTILINGLDSMAAPQDQKDWVNDQVFPFTVNSRWFRIEAVARLNTSKIEKNIIAIADREDSFRINYWHE